LKLLQHCWRSKLLLLYILSMLLFLLLHFLQEASVLLLLRLGLLLLMQLFLQQLVLFGIFVIILIEQIQSKPQVGAWLMEPSNTMLAALPPAGCLLLFAPLSPALPLPCLCQPQCF
jgi:hypothetical protein